MPMLRKFMFTALLAFVFTAAGARVSRQTADSIAGLLNQREAVCNKACPLYESENPHAGLVNTLFIDVLVLIGTVWLYSNYRKKYLLGIGAGVVIVVTGSLLLRGSGKSSKCLEYEKANYQLVANARKPAPTGGLSDFQQMDSTPPATAATAATDEFSSLSPADSATTVTQPAPAVSLTSPELMDPLVAFVLIALVGIGIRYRPLMRFRGLFMLAGVAWFGFYRGGCDCMISSYQNLVLGISGWSLAWVSLVWLGALVVATYLFGRVWCGWLCHLGGVQDFLFHAPKLKLLTGVRSQRWLRVTRYAVFGLWTAQLLLTRKNIFCAYDPFRTLFNLLFTGWVSVALLAVLLVTSVLIYRPFCRTLCPVGVILGWTSLLPGARRMRIQKECVNCGLCSKECAMHALHRKTDRTAVDPENCIACGDCITTCRKGGIKYEAK